MNQNAPLKIDFRQIAETLKQYRWLWLSPVMAMTIASLGYAIVMPRRWSAKQSFLVREEVGNSLRGLGRFDNTEAMKNAQETIQELTRNRESVEAVLRKIGPPANYSDPAEWPTSDEIASEQTMISVVAPNGSEFGKTEVIYLAVTAETKERAVLFATAVGQELGTRLQDLRHRKMESIAQEVGKRSELVRLEQDEATKRLQTFEGEVGSDLGELRSLSEGGGGDSNLRNQQIAIRNDLRQASSQRESWLQLTDLIDTAQKDPDNFLATPSRLLDSQPGLKRIKESIVDMQSQYARLAGMMSADHPRVQEAKNSEREMRDNLYRELKEAQRGVAADLKANDAQIQSLEKQLAKINTRLDQLASFRAKYVNLIADVRRCTETFEKTNKELSDARAAQSGALSTSLITALDAPNASDRPIGPGRSIIVLAGLGGGLATGFGLVFLIAPLGTGGNRLSNYFPFGRRRSDLAKRESDRSADRAAPPAAEFGNAAPRGRRTSDPTPPPPAPQSPPRVVAGTELERRRGDERRGSEAEIKPTPANSTKTTSTAGSTATPNKPASNPVPAATQPPATRPANAPAANKTTTASTLPSPENAKQKLAAAQPSTAPTPPIAPLAPPLNLPTAPNAGNTLSS